MANQIVIPVGIFAPFLGPRRTTQKCGQARPVGGSFAHVAPCRDLSPRVVNLANLGPDVGTWANVSESELFHERPRRNYLLAYDYFKDQSLRGFPPATWANIWITISGRVSIVSYDDWSLPPVMANGTRRLADGLLQLLQAAVERHSTVP
jgi:hypothetical protein